MWALGKEWINIYYSRRCGTARYHLIKAGHILMCLEACSAEHTRKIRKNGRRPERDGLLYKMPENEAETEVCFMKLN